MGAINENLTEIYHKTNGESLFLTEVLSPAEKAFKEKVLAAVTDPTVDETLVAELVWSSENPLLQVHPETGHPVADRSTYDNALFQMLLDLIDRKRIRQGTLDPKAAAARFTMLVKEAAAKLGIHTATVRKAISAKRLSAWKKGATYYLDPVSVESYKVSNRGARAEIQISKGERSNRPERGIWYNEGTDGDFFLHIKGIMKSPFRSIDRTDPIQSGMLVTPDRPFPVLMGKKSENNYRLFILESEIQDEGVDNVLSFAGFQLKGDFRVVSKTNNPRKALEEWKEFDFL